jgi:phosphatidylserine/phosphatidylglycerophosphate/cardiolipin synthase-like enzyme
MKRLLISLLVAVAVSVSACRAQGAVVSQQAAAPPIEVHFSPKGGCTEAVIKELNAANETVLVQAYSFTSVPIAKALLAAHKRGVKVEVILDKSQKTEKYSEADFLVNVGIPVQIDAKHSIAHNKIMVIDGQTVVTGSFNFTTAAEEHNAENLLVIRDKILAGKYTENWQAHAGHSDLYAARTEGYSQTHRAEAVKPAATPVADGYVASKRSPVFHREGCKAAANISDKNQVRYASRDEAIQAGKKPCHECNP